MRRNKEVERRIVEGEREKIVLICFASLTKLCDC